jgi:Spy/CpxP family protein refolding chaperone
MTKLRESRKQKQEELVKAQADLRSVLTVRQEAVMVLAGMLE